MAEQQLRIFVQVRLPGPMILLSLSDLCGATGSASVIFTATDDVEILRPAQQPLPLLINGSSYYNTAFYDLTVECDGAGNTADLNAWLASNGGAVASDICSGLVTWSNDFISLSDLCGATGSASVIFTATDDCGNTSATIRQPLPLLM